MMARLILLSCLLASALHQCGATNPSDATRVSFFHAFSDSKTIMETLVSQESAMVESQNDVIIVTTPGTASSSTGSLINLKTNYTITDTKQVAFMTSKWKLAQENSMPSSTWTRLESLDKQTAPDVCAIVVPDVSDKSSRLVEALEQAKSFCGSADFIIFGTTAPLSDEMKDYVVGKSALNDQYNPLKLSESVMFGRLAQSSQMNISAAVNRLFVGTSDSKCLENSVGATLDAGAYTDMSMSVCIGSGCTTCATEPEGSDPSDANKEDELEPRSSGKGGLIVVLSCGSFILGCGAVFYVLFRKDFFTPSESTKQEKDLATNLAYVLRV